MNSDAASQYMKSDVPLRFEYFDPSLDIYFEIVVCMATEKVDKGPSRGGKSAQFP